MRSDAEWPREHAPLHTGSASIGWRIRPAAPTNKGVVCGDRPGVAS